MAREKIKLMEEAISEILLLTLTWNQVLKPTTPTGWKTKCECKKLFVTRE
jgi:hypothetical protein